MTLYSYNKSYPQPIPFRIRLSDGRTRTDPSSFTEEELTDAGYTAAPDIPLITDSQTLSWSSESMNWVVTDKTQEELDQESNDRRTQLKTEINEYRNFLIATGFWFDGVKYDSRPDDQKRISGAALLAFMAISNGAQVGDYVWHGGIEPFSWITQDNNVVQMDAQTVVAFGQTAAEHERAHIFAARALKDMDPIPEDYNNPIYWPLINS